MITEKENTRISKMLSLALRHRPEAIGITLDENGWTNVEVLIEQLNKNDFHVTAEILRYIVDSNNKRRFSFNDDLTKIRASQGHSLNIDLAYTAQSPPEILFHGTAERLLVSIMATGLKKQARHHVHLTANVQTAVHVVQRYGRPVVVGVRAMDMYHNGFEFFLSDNDVWLTAEVPASYIFVKE